LSLLVFTNGSVVLNGVDLSSVAKSIGLNVEAEEKETTAFSATGFKSHIGGLKGGSLSITFNQDFAASSVDATLWPLLGTVVSFAVKPVNAATSATNPSYSGEILVTGYSPIANGVGDLAEVQVQFPTTGVVTRATA
jgi:hypothetical protein